MLYLSFIYFYFQNYAILLRYTKVYAIKSLDIIFRFNLLIQICFYNECDDCYVKADDSGQSLFTLRELFYFGFITTIRSASRAMFHAT